MVDLTRDDGCLHAHLLDAVKDRFGRVYASGSASRASRVTVTVGHATLDPFRSYLNCRFTCEQGPSDERAG